MMDTNKILDLFQSELVVVNVGSRTFATALENQGFTAVQVDWIPPAGGDGWAAGDDWPRCGSRPAGGAAHGIAAAAKWPGDAARRRATHAGGIGRWHERGRRRGRYHPTSRDGSAPGG